jgi:hypothetical protein
LKYAAYLLTDFIRSWGVREKFSEDLVAQLAQSEGCSFEDVWKREAPACIQEFMGDRLQTNQKRARSIRFNDLVSHSPSQCLFLSLPGLDCVRPAAWQINNMYKEYRILLPRPCRAESIFNTMQDAIKVFRVLTKKHRLYSLLAKANEDPATMDALLCELPDCCALV